MLQHTCRNSGLGGQLSLTGRRERRRRLATSALAWRDGDIAAAWPAESDGYTRRSGPDFEAPGLALLPDVLANGAAPDTRAHHAHAPGTSSPDTLATGALEGLAWLWQLLESQPSGRERWLTLLRLAVTDAERHVRVQTLNCIGQFASASSDQSLAHMCFQEALVIGRASHSAVAIVRSLDGLTGVAVGRGGFELARSLQEEAVAIRRRLGDRTGLAHSLAMLGWLSLESHGAERAEALLEECLTVRVVLGKTLPQAYALVHLGWLALLDGKHAAARAHITEALEMVRDSTQGWKISMLLTALRQPVRDESLAQMAVRLLVSAELLEATETGTNTGAAPADDIQAARSRLEPHVLALAWAGGPHADARSLVEQVLRDVEANTEASRNGVTSAADRQLLTERELEVAMLIGKGYTNRRIADELIIAERTAETHARNIREKLGLVTRSQVAAWAAVRAAARPA
ncbi:MAG: LuxR C-terminal-related transcriptional regulator [Chloroflexota bacterium]